MKLISWNIDSLNAALTHTSPRGELTFKTLNDIAQMQPDVFAIQETKLKITGPTKKHLEVLDEIFPDYEISWRSSSAKSGYSGTMFLYKKTYQPEITNPVIDAPEPMDNEGRIITLDFGDFYVSNVYTPNAGTELVRLEERGQWDDKYREYIVSLDQEKPVIFSGDFNVAHKEIDLKNPDSNHMSPGFTDQEREKFSLLLDAGFTDTFRYKHGDVTDKYTWWSQRVKTAKQNNSGWRIDYYLVSNRIADKIQAVDMIDTGARQDHAPIILEINI